MDVGLFCFMQKKIIGLELSLNFQHQMFSCPYDVMCEVFAQLHLLFGGEIDELSQYYVCGLGKLWYLDISKRDVKFIFF